MTSRTNNGDEGEALSEELTKLVDSRWPGRGQREIWASFDDETVRVYQAYRDDIADAALAAQSFVHPWSPNRTTWIKPSQTWMGYRSGWSRKEKGQRRILAIDLRRDAFDRFLEEAVLAKDQGTTKKGGRSDVVVQWDPERAPFGPGGKGWHTTRVSDTKSLQMGLRGDATRRYASPESIARITEVTREFLAVYDRLAAGDWLGAAELLMLEEPYPLPLPPKNYAILREVEESSEMELHRTIS